MLEQRIQQQFFESADLKYQAAEVLGRPIADAVQALVAGLTSGGRLLVAGLGESAALAQLAGSALIGRFERDRPGLAAVVLGHDGVALAALASTGRTGGAVKAALGETDVLMPVPSDRRARVLETQLLVLHCLCDAIDLQLMGEQDPA